jgi:cyclic pyranopterin phosphate synthase
MATLLQDPGLVDGFGRRINYVRLSVTDRCNLRCTYCMAEDMKFLPKRELLTLEEMADLGRILVSRGVRRIRLTGGEPLVRRGILQLVENLGALIGQELEELTMTTNGTQLAPVAADLFAAGMRRLNVSLDSLDPDRFRAVTRGGRLEKVIAGIDAAREAGLAVKINMVALKGINQDEFPAMLQWCGARGLDLSLIETMPLGEVEEDRTAHYLPLDAVRSELEQSFTLLPTLYRTSGPSRYFDVEETGTRLGLITPLTNNFCAGCNRVRITATGTIYGCLGHDQHVELRDLFRSGGKAAVDEALDLALRGKPQRHEFDIAAAQPAVQRHMSVTGG